MDYKIVRLSDNKELKQIAAAWFHRKWGVPLDAYLESIEESFGENTVIPSWYLCLDGNQIIGGMGVIDNDFHTRKDLTPNVCAIYTEEEYRSQGIAGELLNYVSKDMVAKGIHTLYLVTDHVGFYERYGWEFLCMVQGDGESELSRMYIHRK